MTATRSDDTSDRVIRDASALLDALDRGYLGPSDRADMTTEWTVRLRRSLAALDALKSDPLKQKAA